MLQFVPTAPCLLQGTTEKAPSSWLLPFRYWLAFIQSTLSLLFSRLFSNIETNQLMINKIWKYAGTGMVHFPLTALPKILSENISAMLLAELSEPRFSQLPLSALGSSPTSVLCCYLMLRRRKASNVCATSAAQWMLIQVQSQRDVTQWLMPSCKMLPPAGWRGRQRADKQHVLESRTLGCYSKWKLFCSR